MLNFEACPRCCHIFNLERHQLKPMVLSGDDREMQCDICNKSFKLSDSEALRDIARQQRRKKYAEGL